MWGPADMRGRSALAAAALVLCACSAADVPFNPNPLNRISFHPVPFSVTPAGFRRADPDAARNRIPDSAPPTPVAPAPAAPAAPTPVTCTATGDGLTFAVEKCNKTNNTVIKVKVNERFVATVPTGPPPTTPAAFAAPAAPSAPARDFSPDDYWYSSEEEEGSARSGDSGKHWTEEEEEGLRHWGRLAHHTTSAPPRHHHSHPHHQAPAGGHRREPVRVIDWTNFCKEAASDVEEPFRLPDGNVPPKYEAVPGAGYFRFRARPLPWEEARRACERDGATLAVPNSREEALALRDIHNRCPRILASHFNDYQYLGVHDIHSEGHWETLQGEKLEDTGYEEWAPNQPDNAHHDGENCLTMNRLATFNDVPCWTPLPFTCEFE